MYKYLSFVLCVFIFSCQNDQEKPLDQNILSDYIELNSDLESDFLIACAAGKEGGM